MTSNFEKNDKNTILFFFREQVKDFVERRKWSKYHRPKNLIQAMNIELAELSELFLFKNIDNKAIKKDKDFFQRIQEELADVFIYLISFVNSLDFDLTSAFLQKMKKNSKKYTLEEFSEGNYYKK
jgi:NTP pyrophosphatase (non-canonical NTP hydrolase)